MNKTDWILLSFYLGLNLLIGLIYGLNLYDREFITKFYFLLPFIFFFLVFDVFHKRFWNKNVLLIWGILGLIQFVLYFMFKDLPQFQAVNGNALTWLKALPITIVTMFCFNLVNKKLYGDNFIVTTMRLNPNKMEPEDGRKLRPADYMFSVGGSIIIIFLTIFTA